MISHCSNFPITPNCVVDPFSIFFFMHSNLHFFLSKILLWLHLEACFLALICVHTCSFSVYDFWLVAFYFEVVLNTSLSHLLCIYIYYSTIKNLNLVNHILDYSCLVYSVILIPLDDLIGTYGNCVGF